MPHILDGIGDVIMPWIMDGVKMEVIGRVLQEKLGICKTRKLDGIVRD